MPYALGNAMAYKMLLPLDMAIPDSAGEMHGRKRQESNLRDQYEQIEQMKK
jgi:hypothetical protein